MARDRRRGGFRVSSLLLLCIAAALLGCTHGQMPKSSKPKTPAVKSDVPYILCGVCQELAKALVKDVKELQQSKGNKFKEDAVLEHLEKVCDPEAEAGEWLTKLDMVEDGSKIKLVAQPGPGKCGVECRTMARACGDVMGDSDTDLSEALYAKATQKSGGSGGGLTRGWLEPLLCHSLSKACAAPPPRVPPGRQRGPGFEAKSAQDVEMDKLMRSMAGIPGMPGMSMYSRDDLAGLSEGMGGGDDDDDDGDDVAPVQATRKGPQKAAAKKEGSTTAAGALSAGLGEAASLVSGALDSAVEKAANSVAGAWKWAEERLGGGKSGEEL